MIERSLMTGTSGEKISEDMAQCLQMQSLVLGDKVAKARWILSKACLNQKNTTKEEMRSEILKAEAILSEVQIALVGRT